MQVSKYDMTTSVSSIRVLDADDQNTPHAIRRLSPVRRRQYIDSETECICKRSEIVEVQTERRPTRMTECQVKFLSNSYC